MSSYSTLQAAFIDAGLPAAAVNEIVNALANLATPREGLARSVNSSAPKQRMRMITAEDRRSLFTNLDQPADSPFKDARARTRGRYADTQFRHSYEDAEPLTTTPSITQPIAKAGPGLKVNTEVNDNQIVTTYELDVQGAGNFLRRDAAERSFTAVALSVTSASKGFLTVRQDDAPDRTQFTIQLKNLVPITVQLADGNTQEIYAFVPPS